MVAVDLAAGPVQNGGTVVGIAIRDGMLYLGAFLPSSDAFPGRTGGRPSQ